MSIRMVVASMSHHSYDHSKSGVLDAATQTMDIFSVDTDDEDEPTSAVSCTAIAPVIESEYNAPGPAVHTTLALAVHAAAPVIENVASAPANKFVASAPVIESVAPAPEITLLEPPEPVVQVAQVPRVQVIEKTVEFPVGQTAQRTQTPESLEIFPVCEMKPTVTEDVVEVGPVIEYVTPSPVIEYATPASEPQPVENPSFRQRHCPTDRGRYRRSDLRTSTAADCRAS